ncbi:conserved hypothetical protein, partial [Ricinus communis]
LYYKCIIKRSRFSIGKARSTILFNREEWDPNLIVTNPCNLLNQTIVPQKSGQNSLVPNELSNPLPIVQEIWVPPLAGLVKINFDAVVFLAKKEALLAVLLGIILGSFYGII